jgi:hypothetical protein
MPLVARFTRLMMRRTGVVGFALTAWDLWRRIPKKQRRQIARQVRKHGPKVAKRAVEYRRARRKP